MGLAYPLFPGASRASRNLTPDCYDYHVANRTEPKTVAQWIRYIVVAAIALFLVWWMLRLYVF